MEITNLAPKNKKDNDIINVYAPRHPFRLVINGGSGTGKTNMLANLVMKYLVYDRIYIYSRHLDDPRDPYLGMIDFFDRAEKKIQKRTHNPDYKMCWASNDPEDIPEVEDFESTYKNLVIIDDMINVKNQNNIKELFTSGRHRNCSIIYLGQRYHNIPEMIRSNANYFAIFKPSQKRDKRLIADELSLDVDYDDFKQLMDQCFKRRFGFLVVDRETDEEPLKVRNGWDGLLMPKNDQS